MIISNQRRLEVRQEAAHSEDRTPHVKHRYRDFVVKDLVLLRSLEGALYVNARSRDCGRVGHFIHRIHRLPRVRFWGNDEVRSLGGKVSDHVEALVSPYRPMLVYDLEETAEPRDDGVGEASSIRARREREGSIAGDSTEELERRAALVGGINLLVHEEAGGVLARLLVAVDERLKVQVVDDYVQRLSH